MAEAKLDLLVVAAYGYRVPVADLRSIDAMVNVHPSFLPEGRGPNPLVHLADGRAGGAGGAGVTLHLLDADFDTGPILSQERFENLSDDPSLADLTLSALAVAPMLLNNLLDDLDHYIAGARSQDTGSYWPGEQPEEG